MRVKRVFIISIIILSLIFMHLLVLAENNQKVASHFESNGDLINGWYWLRDANLKHYAQWTFQNIPAGSEDLVLNITALATDRPSGSRGCEAKFKLIYGFPGSGNMGGVFKTKTVILPNVSAPNDPSGYTCGGQVSIDRAFIPRASTIVFRVERDSAQDNHIAFKEDSITMLAEVGEEGLGEEELEEEEEEQPLEEEQLPETNTLEEATLVQSGNYTGSLGEKDQEGHRDNDDYYQINLEEGQLITLQLTIPGNASYGITLLNPHSYSRGSSTTQGNVKTLDYVADSTGSWYIKISRSSGEGKYRLSIDVENQNDAGSGQDAGDSYQEAIPISTGTITGLLKAGDNEDYYSISLEEGQQINLQLGVPCNASFNISLLNPNRNSRGSSTTQLDTKTLDYVADSTGTWYVKVSRSSGEGEYQLSVNDFTDGSEGEENHPPVISSLTSSQNSVEVNQTANLSCTASDRDGDTLTHNWTVNGQLVGGNTSSLNWVAPGIPGTYHITCTVSDSKGSQDSDSVSIIVIEPGGSSDQIPT